MAGGKEISTDGMQYLLLRQRVAQTLDTTGWSSVLILLDVGLSFISVLLYIVMTYNILVLYDVDFALAIFFALNWLFWYWLAEDRLRYVFSFMSLIDFVTITPSFVLYSLEGELAIQIPGLNFLRVLRILRVLRVFQMGHVMQRHLEGAVVEAAGKLIFSLLSILFIAAGLFYELEKFGPSDPNAQASWKADLQFHQALYWASVTLTTVGYGDFSPTWWATQMMLILLLVLTFTLLPYLTGQLMDALQSTTHFQRCRFSDFTRRSDVGHVVFMGAIDGSTMAGLMNELYHEDKGFNHQRCVFLSPRAPGLDQKHVLATHHAASKMYYIQGTPFRTEDLNRAACEYASAIFLIAPKHAEEPLLADRHTIMTTLSLGQYLQEAHVRLRCELQPFPRRLWHWYTHGHVTPPRGLPTVFIQMMLPEGRIRLHQVLRSLQDTNRDAMSPAPSAYSAATAAAEAAGAAAAEQLQRQSAAARVSDGARGSRARFVSAAADNAHDFLRQHSTRGDTNLSQQQQQPQPPRQRDIALEAGAAAGAAAAVKAAKKAAAAGISVAGTVSTEGIGGKDRSRSTSVRDSQSEVATGAAYWRKYGHAMRVMCLSDLKHAMMAHTLLGVPGLMTLMSNLSTTTDFGTEASSQSSGVPQWLKDYMMGASQELYEVVAFPAALHGETFQTAASFIYDHCRAVLLAIEGTKGDDKHHLDVAALDQVISDGMRGYIIAEDIGSVVNIMATEDDHFEIWRRQSHERRAGLEDLYHDRAAKHQQWVPAAMFPKSAMLPVRRQSMKESLTLQKNSWCGDDRDSWLFDPRSTTGQTADAARSSDQQYGSSEPAEEVPGGTGPSVANAAAASAAVAAISTTGAVGHSSKDHIGALAAVIHLLRSPSRQLQEYGESFMRHHYHLRQQGAVQSSASMVVTSVPEGLSGHLLVLGVPRSQESLLALLAPLRSRRLNELRPIVIIDAQSPGRGGCWDTLAKFKHTYFIQMREGLNEALLNANAESASHAMLLSPLSAHEDEAEDNKLASKVLTDAMVIHMYQLLRSLNPHMQPVLELMLPQNLAYLAPTVPLKGVPRQQQLMLSPASLAGSVFMSRTLDDLTIASYCNNTGDRILLQLLHRWHLAGRTIERVRHSLAACKTCDPEAAKESRQQQQQACQSPDVEMGFGGADQDRGNSSSSSSSYKRQQQRQRPQVHFGGECGEPCSDDTDDDGDHDGQSCAAAAADSAAAGGDLDVSAPTIIMIPVSCPPGTPYIHYFHHLLFERRMLLLGIYRLVDQGRLMSRATITNPHRTTMQEKDLAYVISTLRFPESFDNGAAAATAAAWPSDALGFNNLDPKPADVNDPLDRVDIQDQDAEQQQQQQQEGPADGEGEESGAKSNKISGCDEVTAGEAAEEPAAAGAAGTPPKETHPPVQQQQQQQQRPQTPWQNATGQTQPDVEPATSPPSSQAMHTAFTPAAAAAAAVMPAAHAPTRSLPHTSSMPPCLRHGDSSSHMNPSNPFNNQNRDSLGHHSAHSSGLGSDCMGDMYAPPGAASSGTVGPGMRPTGPHPGDISLEPRRRSVILTPGHLTTIAKTGSK